MNVSGIVVGLAPAAFAPSLAALGALPGVRIHQQDRKASRVVVTQEAETSDAQEEGLRRIQALAGVTHAELVYHFFDDGADGPAVPLAAPTAAAPTGDQALIQLGVRT